MVTNYFFCEICKQNEAIAKVKNKLNNQILFICPYCEFENKDKIEKISQQITNEDKLLIGIA